MTLRQSFRAFAGFSAAAIVTACIVQQPAGPPPQQPQQPGQEQAYAEPPPEQGQPTQTAGVPNGEYYCSFTVGQYSYPNFPCVVYTRRDGRQVLEKVAGSQRIHGTINANDRGFDFQGTFFCPWGSCTEEVSARFVRSGQQLFQGTLLKQTGSRSILVKLQYLPGGLPRGYGGRYYGGVRYGYGYGYYGGGRRRR